MAVMDETQRKACTKAWILRVYVSRNATAKLDTIALKAAVDAVDQWFENNVGSLNAALPEPFKSTATGEEKTMMLVHVVMKRVGLI